MKKVNASTCAPPTTDHDPAGVIPDKKRKFVFFVFFFQVDLFLDSTTAFTPFFFFYLMTQCTDFACKQLSPRWYVLSR